MTHVVWLDEIRKDDIVLAGGKGANLGELSRAGLPVPSGLFSLPGPTTPSSRRPRRRSAGCSLETRFRKA